MGLAMAYIIDGGETIVGQAARIHPQYQKLGIFRKLRAATDSTNPGAKYFATTFTDWRANQNVPHQQLLMKRVMLPSTYIAFCIHVLDNNSEGLL